MKILILQERGRHEANRHFREALSFQRAFTKLGHEAIVWGLGYETHFIPFEEISKGCDIVFLLEQYDQAGWVPDLSKFNGPRVFFTIDSHCNLSEHVTQAERQQITHLLSSTERYLDYYHSTGMKKYWFPNAYDDTLIYPMPEVEKVHSIGFCGNVVNRGQWIDRLISELAMKTDIFVIGNDMVKAINSYQIHWNRNIDIDINFRNFETAGCKTMLMTNYVPNLEKLFEIGREIATYSSGEDLTAKVRYYLEHPGEREAIAEAGYQRVKRDHTYLERAKRFLEIINEG